MSGRFKLIIIMCAVAVSMAANAQKPSISIEPEHYICYRADRPVTIDGLLREPCWSKATWSEDFVDIEGSLKPLPRFSTKVKMLWDDEYLYIAAQMEEPHVWATLRQRDTVIFYDNDFEVFIDPDGDAHDYLELEINALNTVWDLMLLKPYRDENSANVAIDHWNYNGLKSAVFVDGTLNNPADTDRGWVAEIAIPLDALAEVSAHGKKPVDGEQYRVNFSRVEWQTDIINRKYWKRTHLVDGAEKALPEDNWVWSPQGVINMHCPETWGFVQFSMQKAGTGTAAFVPDPDSDIMKALWMLYHSEANYYSRHSRYTADMQLPGMNYNEAQVINADIKIQLTASGYEAVCRSHKTPFIWHITHDGRIWKDQVPEK